MTYIVWFNRKYQRQFEVVVKKKLWKWMEEKYGTVAAAGLLLSHMHKVRHKKDVTPKSERSAQNFILGSLTRPDIFGAPVIRIGKSKKAILDRGQSELVLKGTKVKRYARKKRKTHRRRK